MDDTTFDDLMKKKLEGFEDPVFDPSSLDAMHQLLSGVSPTPWYGRTASRLFVTSAFTVFTLVNGALLYSFLSPVSSGSGNGSYAKGTSPEIKTTYVVAGKTIDSLNSVINKMKCDLELAENKINNDRPYGESAKPTRDYVSDEPSTDESAIRSKDPLINAVTPAYGSRNDKNNDGHHFGTGYVDKEDPFYRNSEFLTERSPLVIEKTLLGPLRIIESPNNWESASENNKKNSPGPVSLSTQKALEKHYFRGLGVEVAPHVDLVQGIFKSGESDLHPRFGIAADLILSPNFSLETGVDYLSTSSRFNPGDVDVASQPYNSQYGYLRSVSTKYTLLSLPVAFKYRQWITSSKQIFFKVGVTPYASANRELQYAYEQLLQPSMISGALVQVTTHDDGFRYFGMTTGAAVGLISKLKNPKNKVEMSLFYERSLGTVGQEYLNMQLAGIRAAYWFKLK
jgi:hypothetical protein